MALIEIKRFSYTYHGETVPALKSVDLSLERGAFAVLTGASGSGKSTLGKALAGFLFADPDPQYSGKIIVNGVDMTQLPLYQASERVAYVQQNPEDQFCTLSVQDEIAFGLENLCLHPIIIEQKIDKALKVVKGMDLKNRELHSLSGGEKQKVAIASMLALNPDLLILDEPTSNLDPFATQKIFESLNNLSQVEAMTVIIIEHKLDQLLELDPVIFSLDQGQISKGYHLPNPSNQQVYFSSPGKVSAEGKSSIDEKNPVIQMKDATINIKGHEILHSINFTLAAGEFVALMGTNGSGKSTLLQTIMGFHQLAQGECIMFGKNADRLKTSERVPNIGFIFQNPDHQIFTQSVWEEITLTLKNLGQLNEANQQHARRWLDNIGLQSRHKDHPQRLSYGEKRRLNLAAILLHAPRLLLIDELLIGQDPFNANLWMRFLKKISETGVTVLLVIHQPRLTLKYCDRVVFLEAGQIVIDNEVSSAFNSLLELGYHAFLPSAHHERVYA